MIYFLFSFNRITNNKNWGNNQTKQNKNIQSKP